jgi:Rrf2 family protein
MSASTKLSNSIKALCFLAYSGPQPYNSSEISKHTGVNASKIRKLFSDLAKGNIIKSIQGPSGGFMLAKDPSEIHLQEVYCALEHQKAFHLDVSENPKNEMPKAGRINLFFMDLFSEIQVEIEDKMKQITLSDILDQI